MPVPPPKSGLASVATLALFSFLSLSFIAAGLEAIDDAYISFRYARHWVDGAGPVYNAGEEPVQGYTNFLWVVLVALGLKAGVPAVPFAAAGGFIAGALAAVLSVRWAFQRLAPGLVAASFAPVLLVANQGFVVWSIRGLETGLFTLLVLAAGLSYLRRGSEAALSPRVGLLLALATLTRPEGALAFGLTVAHAGMARLARRRAPLRRADLPALALFVTIVGAYVAWTLLYYGDPLPNTFYAKVGSPHDSIERGWSYLRKFLDYPTGAPLLLLPFCLLPRARVDEARSYLALMVAGFALAVAATGGDVFPAYRFLVPIFPFLYLLVADGAAALERLACRPVAGRLARASVTGGLAVLAASLALWTYRPSAAFAWREWERGNAHTAELRMVGRWLREQVPPGTWIALNPAGALPYESGLPAIDMLGLNDRVIAHTPIQGLGSGRFAGHEKGNGLSVFERRPEIILVGGVTLAERPLGTRWTPHFRSEIELAALPDLYQVYAVDAARMEDGRILTFLRRRGSGPVLTSRLRPLRGPLRSAHP